MERRRQLLGRMGLGLVALALFGLSASMNLTQDASGDIWCKDNSGQNCTCNCDSFEQECVVCDELQQYKYCNESFYGGKCRCNDSGDGVWCASTGVCCIWV